MLTSTLPTLRRRRPAFYGFLFYATAALLAGVVLSIAARDPGIERTHEIKIIPQMVYHLNERPIVNRALVPELIRLGTLAIPAATRAEMARQAREHPFISHNFEKYGWVPDYTAEYLVALVALYLCLIGFFFAFRLFVRSLWAPPREALDALSLTALAGLPVMTRDLHTLYDWSTLAFMALLLGLMARRRWRLYLPLFLLATFNRETTLLLILIFSVVFFNRLAPRRWLALAGAQLGLWLAARLVLGLLFHDNPGHLAQMTFAINIRYLLLAETYGLAQLLAVVAMIYLLFYRWEEKPLFLRRALWIFPVHLAILLVVGILSEWRIYLEWYPIAMALIFDSAARLGGIDLKPRPLLPARPQ